MQDTSFSNIAGRSWYILCLLLLLPALFINLDMMSFIDDEGIRSLVALEMNLSNNYITPTLHGEYYYKKPPLFNWFVSVLANTGLGFGEFTSRLLTILSLLGFSSSVFFYLRRYLPFRESFLVALALITCGRILWYDSMLGLIDTLFSWVTFGVFVCAWEYYRANRMWALFLSVYLLCAAGFMLKGLPAVVFQGCTLIALFVWQRDRRFFSLPHVAGGLLWVALVGGYYAVYNQYNSLENVFSTLFTESSSRTAVKFGMGKTILHLFTFPLEMIYHFLPWTLLVVYLGWRFSRQQVAATPWMQYFSWTLLANILVYWISVEVYPRYLLMFLPLVFALLLGLHTRHETENTKAWRVLSVLFGSLISLLALGVWAVPFLERTATAPGLWLKTAFLGTFMALCTWGYWRYRAQRLVILGAALLVLRIGFNWFVLPDRLREDYGTLCRESSLEAGRQFADRPMYVLQGTGMQPTNSFYLTVGRGSIIPIVPKMTDSSAVYIIDKTVMPGLSYRKVGEINVRHGHHTYDLGTIR